MPRAPNLVNETFEGPGYTALTGTASVSGTSILDPDLSTALLGYQSAFVNVSRLDQPAEWGEQCLRCTSQGANTEIRKPHSLASAETGTLYFRDEVYISSESIASGAGSIFFTAWNLAFDNNLFHIMARRDGTFFRFQFQFNDGGTAVTVDSAAIVANRKYSIEVMFDLATHAYEARVDGATVGSGTLASATQTQFQTLIVGSDIFSTTGPIITILHDNVGVGNQGWLDPALPLMLWPLPRGLRPLIIDPFDRIVASGAGTAPSGLDTNKVWTTINGNDSDVNVDGAGLVATLDTGYWAGIIGSINCDSIVETVTRVSNFQASANNFRMLSVFPRILSLSHYYECRFNNDQGIADNTFTWQINKVSAGSSATLKQSPSGGTIRIPEFWLKGRCENTPQGVIVRLKFWDVQVREPLAWTMSVLDDQPGMITVGRVGLKVTNENATTDTRVEHFAAYSMPDQPQAPPNFLGMQA